MSASTRRTFLAQAAAGAAGFWLARGLAHAETPQFTFPSAPRQRICVASYPFRSVIPGEDASVPKAEQIALKDFAAHVKAKFGINKIEPWSRHFPSTDEKYLNEFRAAVDRAGCQVIDIAVDGEDSPYAVDAAERSRAVSGSKKWVDVARLLGSSSIRTHIPRAHDSKPDVDRTAESLQQVAEDAAAHNVVVSLENDDPVSEDPFFIVQVIDKVQSPWLRALPDFGNSVAALDEADAYRAIDAMFAHAYCICHVKDQEATETGRTVHVDLPRTFGYLKQHAYKGYCSMEWDSPGDPYAGTRHLIEQTERLLA